MKLMEYKGKELLGKYNIETQKGVVIDSIENIKDDISGLEPPFVIKVQIMAGGRGKAGGIKFADDLSSAIENCKKLLGANIKGHIVKKLLIAEKVEVGSEWYMSIILDRSYKSPMLIFSPIGGIDIEETAKSSPDKIVKIPINPFLGIRDYISRYVFNQYNLPLEYYGSFNLILSNLYKLFCEYDCTLTEINPLVITSDKKLIAVDCKMDIDDSSLFRHPDMAYYRDSMEENELIILARKYNFLYIPITNDGDIAVMSNGSGMLMSCIDLITKNKMKVGAALDLGGGATSDRISEAIKIIFSNKKISSLFISVFGGITRCDEVANGVKGVIDSNLSDKFLVIRIEGTNKEIGLRILKNIGSNVLSVNSISEGVKALNSRRHLK